MGVSESKQKFAQRVGGMLKTPFAADHPLWAELFDTQTSRHLSSVDVLSLLKPATVRELMQAQPDNARILIEMCCKKLEELVAKPISPDHDAVLLSIRLLTRIIPVLHEKESRSFVVSQIWSNLVDLDITDSTSSLSVRRKDRPLMSGRQAPSAAGASSAPATVQASADDDVTSAASSNAASQAVATAFWSRIARATFRSLFVPGFTVSAAAASSLNLSTEGSLCLPFVWTPGVAVSAKTALPSSAAMDRNRCDCLKLLLALLGDVMYAIRAAAVAPQRPVRTLCSDAICSWRDAERMPHSHTALVSLINVVLGYDPSTVLPYSSTFFSLGPRDELVKISARVLAALLDYPHPGNQFRGLLGSISSPEDVTFMYDGFVKLMTNPLDAFSTYLPSSTFVIDFHNEVLFLLWRLVAGNTAFLAYATAVRHPAKLLNALLFLSQDGLFKRETFLQAELCMYILLMLSSIREFGMALNDPYDNKQPLFVANGFKTTHPNYFDLLVLLFFRQMLQGPPWIASLYDCLLTILANVSVYCKTLHAGAAEAFVQMVEVFSRPAYLTAHPANHGHLVYLMDALNTMLQYHYEGTVDVLVEVLKRRIVFQQLASLPELQLQLQQQSAAAATETSERTDEQRLFEENPSAFEIEWKRRLPLQPILCALQELVPHLSRFYDSTESATNTTVLRENDLRTWLQKITLVGVLPVPHAVVVRRYTPDSRTDAWMQCSLWSVIFQKTLSAGLFDYRHVTLFPIDVVVAAVAAAAVSSAPTDAGATSTDGPTSAASSAMPAAATAQAHPAIKTATTAVNTAAGTGLESTVVASTAAETATGSALQTELFPAERREPHRMLPVPVVAVDASGLAVTPAPSDATPEQQPIA